MLRQQAHCIFSPAMRKLSAFLSAMFLAFFLSSFAITAAHATTQIRDIRLWTAPDHTRLVFDLSAAARYELLRLHDPERIVIDVHNSKITTTSNTLALPDPVLLSIRYGSQKDNLTRIVLDVREGVTPRTFLLNRSSSKPHRLVVDLYPKQKAVMDKTSITPANKKREIVIAVDAGHGGEDPGAIGQNNIQEKKVTLAVAKLLASKLNAQPNIKAVLVRDGDYYVKLSSRVNKVRTMNADMMISIHADAVDARHVKGASVYTLSESGATPDRVAAAIAAKENAADEIGGAMPEQEVADPLVRGILGDMAKRDGLDSSELLANLVIDQLKDAKLPIKYIKPKHARFAVLTTLEMPSILVEMDYISNPKQEKLLDDAQHQAKLADSMMMASLAFFERMGRFESPKAIIHIVSPGDSLWSIAKQYGVEIKAIRSINQLDQSGLKIGQRLIMPQS